MCSPSTPHRPLSAVRCTWDTCSLTHIPTPLPATGACAERASFIQWVGTTTAYPPNVACRTISEFPVTRLSPTSRTSLLRSVVTHQKITNPFRSRAPISSNCAKSSLPKTKRFSRTSSVVSDCQLTGPCCTPPLTCVHVAQVSVHSCAT